ncbi:MAG: hypothetical protein ACI4QI_08070 [Candidatus Coproplasma sp.]
MAEERLIDTDKDKKYRIRKNADGEDELYIDDSEQAEEVEEVTFMAEDEAEEIQDDYADGYTLSEEEDREQKAQEAESLIQQAKAECAEGRFATAADYLEKATELDETNGEIYALQLIIYTRNLTDYSRISDAAEYAEELKKYTSSETKAELFERAKGGLEDNIELLSINVDSLSSLNDMQKRKRAEKFVADKKKTAILFSVALAITAVLAGLAIYCFLNIHSVTTNSFLIAAIVLAAVGAVGLVITCVLLRKLLTACRRVRLNNRDTSTELGRNLLAKKAELNAFTAIYEALKG